MAGYTSEHAAYHHGEASLNGAIINMAQDFIGSNNMNLLMPNGQFGTRLMGGKDAASPRYVFTQLMKITELIFHPDDAPLMDYLEDGEWFLFSNRDLNECCGLITTLFFFLSSFCTLYFVLP